MKNSKISDKEIVVCNEDYAVIVFDDLNYDMLQRSIVESAKDDPEKGIKKGDKREVWKSIPCYSSNAQSAIKKYLEYSLKKSIHIEPDFISAVNKMEEIYSATEKTFNFESTIEYKKFKEDQADAIAKLRKSRD
jgi:hypothetical protein